MSSTPSRNLPRAASPAAPLTYVATPPAGPYRLDEDPPSAPLAPQLPSISTIHGDIRPDEFAWLRHRDDPAVLAYLEAENRYTAAVMRPTEPLQERLFGELRGRIRETDLSVPQRLDGWLYYSRTEAGGQYPIYCRRRDTDGNAEEIVLDPNLLACGHDYFRLGAMEVSPDHRLLAYSVDTSGAEAFTLTVRDLSTGEARTDRITNTSPSVAWANDSATLFYVVINAARRPCRLYRHKVGSEPASDALVHDELDESFFVEINRTRSRALLVLDLSSHSASEVRVLDADRPEEAFRTVEPRRPGVEYAVTHRGDRLYITTNDPGDLAAIAGPDAGAPNFRLVEAPLACPCRANWREILPHRPAVKLDGTDAFRRHLVVWEREAGLRRLRILDLDAGTEHLVRFPEPVYSVRPHENPEFDTALLRFTYTSLVTPSEVVEWEMDRQEWLVRKRTEVRGYDPSCYRSERLEARSPDGTLVPVSLVYRAPIVPGEPRPMLLQGYGAYGLSYDPSFSSNALSLLDRGFVVAIAHVRGGEELGRGWYEGGRRLNKRNSFTDFIAAAEHLIALGYTSPERLAIAGGSAGGLLMGAVMNLRPDLFHAVLAEVPFVDVVSTMLDASLPLTVIEYDEWGNPNEAEAYAAIRAYSPYDNVTAQDYPHLLVTAGLNDPRVAYWEPAKWAARLRSRKTDANRLLLRTNMGAGHGGASGRYDYLREVAFKYAFLLDVMGMS